MSISAGTGVSGAATRSAPPIAVGFLNRAGGAAQPAQEQAATALSPDQTAPMQAGPGSDDAPLTSAQRQKALLSVEQSPGGQGTWKSEQFVSERAFTEGPAKTGSTTQTPATVHKGVSAGQAGVQRDAEFRRPLGGGGPEQKRNAVDLAATSSLTTGKLAGVACGKEPDGKVSPAEAKSFLEKSEVSLKASGKADGIPETLSPREQREALRSARTQGALPGDRQARQAYALALGAPRAADPGLTAAKLVGKTLDPAQDNKDGGKVSAFRRLADRGNDQPGGRPDGVVSAAEAKAFLAEAQTQLKAARKADSMLQGLSSAEQKEVLRRALENHAIPSGDRGNIELLSRALHSYERPAASVGKPAAPGVADDVRITADGLTGSTSDPLLARLNDGRLAAFRRLADRGGDAPGGKPDGFVSEGEAAGYIAQAHIRLRAAGKADGDPAILSAMEQKAVLEWARRTESGPAGNKDNVAVLARALESFAAPDKSASAIDPAIAPLAAAGSAFVETMLPAWIATDNAAGVAADALAWGTNPLERLLSPWSSDAGPIERMFATDNPVTLAIKTFSPNMNLIGPFIGGPDGKKSQYPTGQNTGKLHSWMALRGEVALSRPAVSKDGTVLRSGSFTVAVGNQGEVVAEKNGIKGDVRYLGAVNGGMQIQYLVTTDPARLKQIMTGAVPAPNPYTLEHMKPGDTVTITVGPFASVENEFRALRGKDATRAGLDVKVDLAAAIGDRTVVRMLKPREGATPHVMVFKGASTQKSATLGAGAIWNPKFQKATSEQKRSPDAAFVRLLGQAKEIWIDNRFNFVEVNPGDEKPGGGREVFTQIMTNRAMPVGQTGQALPGVLAHGALDYREDQAGTALQLTGYYEANRPWLGVARGSQVLGQASVDLFSRVTIGRDLYVRQISHASGLPHEVDDLDAANTEVAFGSGTVKTTGIEAEGGETRYTKEIQRNQGTGETKVEYWHTGVNGRKDDIVHALQGDLDDQRAGRQPLFQSFIVKSPDGKELTGQTALDYLKSHKDNRDAGWFSPRIDHVNVRVFTDNDQARTTFAEQVSSDVQKYFEKNKNYYVLTNATQGMEVLAAKLLGGNVTSQNIMNLAGHSSRDFERHFKTMSGETLSDFIDQLFKFRTIAGENRSYPIRVIVDVPY